MSVSKFGTPLKNRGYDARTGRLRPAIESLRNYVRDNALCLTSSVEYDAKERKIKRLAKPEEDADATSKSYVEGITSQLRKDADEAGKGVILLFTRLTQLDNALGKRIDAAESFVSKIEARDDVLSKIRFAVENSVSRTESNANTLDKRIDALDKRINALSNRIDAAKNTISLNAVESSTKSASDRKILFNQAWAQPLKSKSANEVTRALSEIVRDSKRCPKNLQTDKGKEFYNAEVRKFAEKREMNHYSTYSVMKASIVARFNRTLKNSTWKYFTLSGTYKWIDELPRLVEEYNTRNHRTIGMRPVDETPAIANKLSNTVYSNIKIAAPAKFKVANPVRISKFKTIFEKGFIPNWTTEIFQITKIQRTNPVTYLLKD
ncbi:uncharacterized protein LOC115237040 [Formica exsecta]|uniref:uncharacterized protein LOC115237040 n=1 Tax=Formica exsecta TaxID=72781 RepID=UPI0011429479|nr:uncharacterized protein LOC115237040 [Formica exsecta]